MCAVSPALSNYTARAAERGIPALTTPEKSRADLEAVADDGWVYWNTMDGFKLSTATKTMCPWALPTNTISHQEQLAQYPEHQRANLLMRALVLLRRTRRSMQSIWNPCLSLRDSGWTTIPTSVTARRPPGGWVQYVPDDKLGLPCRDHPCAAGAGILRCRMTMDLPPMSMGPTPRCAGGQRTDGGALSGRGKIRSTLSTSRTASASAVH